MSQGETHLACMERGSYESVLKYLEKKALDEAVDFLQSLPVFARWTRRSLSKLTYYFHSRSFARNTIVYRAGEPAASIFVVKRGDFELSCKVTSPYARKSDVNYLECMQTPNKDLITESIYSTLIAKKIFIRSVPKQKVNVRSLC